jgi:hypothetical protein
MPLRERVLAKLVIDPSGCLLWCGGLDDQGYGRVRHHGRRIRVHRVMYQMFVCPIPPGLEPDHVCRVRRCAAPAHLELVTHRVNMLRGASMVAENAVKTRCGTCRRPYDEANTYVTPDGRRDCRYCRRRRVKRYKARKRAQMKARTS